MRQTTRYVGLEINVFGKINPRDLLHELKTHFGYLDYVDSVDIDIFEHSGACSVDLCDCAGNEDEGCVHEATA